MSSATPTSLPPLSAAAASALFAGLCLAWGSGWMALKIGVAALPPLFFAGSRFLAAGALLLAILAARGRLRDLAAFRPLDLAPAALLMIAFNYGLMAWGVMRVASGLAAVVNLTTVPLAMAAFAALHRQARLTPRTGAGLALGSLGLAMLLGLPVLAGPALRTGDAAGAALGLAAVALGAAGYAWGSVLTRRRLPHAPALELSTLQALGGGAALLALSALGEPWAGIADAFGAPLRFGGWAFLVAISVASGPAYLALLARWEPQRVAAYAYVCPVIAVAEGIVFGGERLGAADLAGAGLLGLSAVLVLGASPPTPPVLRAPRPAPAPHS